MKPQEFVSATKNVLLEVAGILEAKNADYAGSQDALTNFKASEWMGINMLQMVASRLNDKWSRFKNIFSGSLTQVVTESLEDTLKDIIGYCTILIVLLRHNKKQ